MLGRVGVPAGVPLCLSSGSRTEEAPPRAQGAVDRRWASQGFKSGPWNVVLALLETARWLSLPDFLRKAIAISLKECETHGVPGDQSQCCFLEQP